MYLSRTLSRKSIQYSKRQRGAALIVGLIMLLLLTLVGVAGMRDTLLQEKMAASMRDRDIALQAAEAALRAAELSLATGAGPVFTNSNGLYDRGVAAGVNATKRLKPVSTGSAVAEQLFWQQSWPWSDTTSVKYNSTLPNVQTANTPRYVIEKLPIDLTDLSKYPSSSFGAGSGNVSAGDELEIDETIINKPDYRVTARGIGMTGDAMVILQATFRRATP